MVVSLNSRLESNKVKRERVCATDAGDEAGEGNKICNLQGFRVEGSMFSG